MNELALFAGAGGGILGSELLGWRTVAAVEISTYCSRRLMQRQNEGHLPPFPVWDDVRTFDGRSWRGLVDVVSGGFPCQDISIAGKGNGIDGVRSGLWKEFARIIREVEPRFAFLENSPALTFRGLGAVLGDLAEMGYDARWGVLGANHVGAPHQRNRIWIVAHAERQGLEGHSGHESQGAESGRINAESRGPTRAPGLRFCPPRWWQSEPELGRVAHGVAHRVDRLSAIGNGQVPAVAALAWQILSQDFFP